MNRRFLFTRLVLPMVVMLGFVNGCNSAKPEIGKEQAIAIAKQEVVRQGGKELEVEDVSMDTDRWVISLWMLPATPGGHATVIVSTNGKVVRVFPGK